MPGSTFNRREFLIGSLLAGIFVTIGAGLLAWGVLYYANVKAFIARAKSAEGTVTGFDRWEGSSTDLSDDIKYAVVTFTTSDGKEVRFKGPSQEWSSSYKTGDKVKVLYDPEKPDDAKIKSFMGLWFASSMLCGVGFCMVFVPLLTLFTYWRSCRK
ncbi:MAG: DUF3592 domain-containing protein [Planctomycetes bacterium]|nr:DUF3592 domain-containing protein [Planctomycetota bacterium]